MELRALRYFVTVAEELHFGRAAQRLNIAQPAVSQQVARLERELGTQLLDRTPRRVALTDAGHRVLAAARDALAAADKVATAAQVPAGGSIRIGTDAGLARRLERGIDALRELHPRFELVLAELPRAARLDAVRRGGLDLALIRGPVPEPGLRACPAWSEPLHAVVSVQHPAAGRETVSLRDLAAGPLRLPSSDSQPALHQAVTSALDQAGVRPQFGRPACSPAGTVVEIGANPCSWTLLPADLAEVALSARVRPVPLDPPVHVTGYVVTADSESAGCITEAVAAFRAAMA
ncbi:MAG TPA: LysR family transcriptional regulator [Trebonia sp.]|jgi:DNA-binding transcriptional LysR family regulator|nr:LysR family transcriptional regulator [Trebonia sp.]